MLQKYVKNYLNFRYHNFIFQLLVYTLYYFKEQEGVNEINIYTLATSLTIAKDLKKYLNTEKSIRLAGHFNDCNETINSIRKNNIYGSNILFINDYSLNKYNLLNFLNETTTHNFVDVPKKILYTNSCDHSYVNRLFDLQIAGIIHQKDTPMFVTRNVDDKNANTIVESKKKFIKIVKLVNEGCTFYDSLITTMLPKRYAWAKSDTQTMIQEFLNNDDKYLQKIIEKIALLTEREKEILMLIAKGIQNKEIASMLHISTATVEQHKAHIIEKINLINTKELTKFAIAYKETFIKI